MLLIAMTPAPASAQFAPWGAWGNPQPWKPKPRVRRRAPRYVEPTDSEPAKALPKPTGPLVIVVSLNNQTVTVYDDGKQIAKSPISSGTRSNPTPTGVFSILQKNRHHYSNLYNSAPMPFMQRLTNSGIALHAGDLPGYPASHGCVRLPYSFARSLFGITDVGARVIISNEDVTPVEFDSPALIDPLPPDNVQASGQAALSAVAAGPEHSLTGVLETAPGQQMTRSMAAERRAAERQRLAEAITEAENAKVAADNQVEAATEAAKQAKQQANEDSAAIGKLAAEAKKATRAAASAEASFEKFAANLARVDVDKLDAAELEKRKAEEIAEEDKVLAAMNAAAAADRVADAQKNKAAKSQADAKALENARRVAADDAKHAVTVVEEAKTALAGAIALEERKDRPVSVFISAKTGRLVAKLGFVQVMDVPITIADPGQALGTHILTALAYTDGGRAMRWSSLTMPPPSADNYSRRKKRRHDDEAWIEPAGYGADPGNALERIEMPADAEQQLAELMKPGSSIIISDYGLSRETSERTEFVVEPWRSRPDSSNYRYY